MLLVGLRAGGGGRCGLPAAAQGVPEDGSGVAGRSRPSSATVPASSAPRWSAACPAWKPRFSTGSTHPSVAVASGSSRSRPSSSTQNSVILVGERAAALSGTLSAVLRLQRADRGPGGLGAAPGRRPRRGRGRLPAQPAARRPSAGRSGRPGRPRRGLGDRVAAQPGGPGRRRDADLRRATTSSRPWWSRASTRPTSPTRRACWTAWRRSTSWSAWRPGRRWSPSGRTSSSRSR